jgi:diguanylate cyclase (GGDEF)-like protein
MASVRMARSTTQRLVRIQGGLRSSVQLKMLGAFGVVVAMMVCLGAFALLRLHGEDQHLVQLASKVVPSTRAVGDINALMNKYRKDQLHYIVARPADRPLSAPGSIQGDLNGDLALMSGYLRAYRADGLIEDPVDRGLLDRFRAAFYRYVVLTASFHALADRELTFRAGDVVGDGAGDHEWDTLKTLITAWSDHKVRTAGAAAAASRSSYTDSIILIVTLLVAAVALAVAIATLISRRATRAVREIGAAAKAISTGNINQRVPVRSRDELGEMAADFDVMIGYLGDTVEIAEAIADGDLDVSVRPRSESDALGNAIARMTGSLRALVGENERLLEATREEANTDALTDLPNRRALMRDLEAAVANPGRQWILGLYDLDGFKQYNDTFGHPTGDALLTRLAGRLQQAVEGHATAYRMGGDEFCVLGTIDGNGGGGVAGRAASALTEKGDAFTIGCSYGIANLPEEASSAAEALRVADQRMYDHKTSRASASRQSADVLLKALAERSPGLPEHCSEVSLLARMTAEALDLSDHEVKRIEVAAELHDVGKVAIPDTILNKPGPLDEHEWEFMRRHTVIGERIISAAPSLARSAELVRASHERYDGRGYPDRLAAEEIPIGARVIAVCDAFDAMTSKRSYSDPISVADALAELQRCSGTQFDPQVVRVFLEVANTPEAMAERAA